jgi:hypothetical protein
MADAIKRGASLPKIPELVRELTCVTYTYVNGKFLIEPKDQIKKRLGFSPDLADGYALTFAQPEAPANFAGEYAHLVNSQGNHVSDYDPIKS